MPLTRRVPKHGFKSRSYTVYQVVNVNTLEKLAADKRIGGSVVSPDALFQVGAISKKNGLVKILGEGELKSKLEVTAHAFSKSAVSKIEAAGGKATVLS